MSFPNYNTVTNTVQLKKFRMSRDTESLVNFSYTLYSNGCMLFQNSALTSLSPNWDVSSWLWPKLNSIFGYYFYHHPKQIGHACMADCNQSHSLKLGTKSI